MNKKELFSSIARVAQDGELSPSMIEGLIKAPWGAFGSWFVTNNRDVDGNKYITLWRNRRKIAMIVHNYYTDAMNYCIFPRRIEDENYRKFRAERREAAQKYTNDLEAVVAALRKGKFHLLACDPGREGGTVQLLLSEKPTNGWHRTLTAPVSLRGALKRAFELDSSKAFLLADRIQYDPCDPGRDPTSLRFAKALEGLWFEPAPPVRSQRARTAGNLSYEMAAY